MGEITPYQEGIRKKLGTIPKPLHRQLKYSNFGEITRGGGVGPKSSGHEKYSEDGEKMPADKRKETAEGVSRNGPPSVRTGRAEIPTRTKIRKKRRVYSLRL